MNKEIYNPLLEIMNAAFNKSTIEDLQKHYLPLTNGITKWTCYSDYCFDDTNKPNDVVCFTIIPYIDDFNVLSSFIKSIAQVDIKKTQKINSSFVDFLNKYPLINFSFVLNEKKNILGNNNIEVKSFLKQTFEFIKVQYIEWSERQPKQKEHYREVIKKIKCVLHLIDSEKKTKQIVHLLLVTFFGAYVSSHIIKGRTTEVFGWFSDRDAINEICNNFSIDLFQYYLHGLTDMQEFVFTASPASSTDNPFYEELVRIPDYIAGTIADYNMTDNLISKDKFDTILTDYMAENIHNNFVFRLFIADNKLSCARIRFHKKTA